MPLPFIPDVPYKIQFIFICCFAYIWLTAFSDDYNEPLPEDEEKRIPILVRFPRILNLIPFCREKTQ